MKRADVQKVATTVTFEFCSHEKGMRLTIAEHVEATWNQAHE